MAVRLSAAKLTALVAVLIAIGYMFWLTAQQNSSSSAVVDQTAQAYSRSDVAQHNTEDDCWTIIGDSVYDLTAYVKRHPGGTEILQACGTDGTGLFESRMTAQGEPVGTGTPHSESAREKLITLRIGDFDER